MVRKSINVDGIAHSQPIPLASRVRGLVVSGGIMGADPGTGTVAAGIKAQTRLVFENVRAVMAAAGGSAEDIARMTFYVVDRSARDLINEHWLEMFPDPQSRPARHTLVHDLPSPMLIQCEVIGFVKDGS